MVKDAVIIKGIIDETVGKLEELFKKYKLDEIDYKKVAYELGFAGSWAFMHPAFLKEAKLDEREGMESEKMVKIRIYKKKEDVIEDMEYPYFLDADGDVVDVRTRKKMKGWYAVRRE